MKSKLSAALLILFCLVSTVYAGEITLGNGGEFKITSRTSFGIDIDNPYRFGLKQELTDFNLIIHLVPYQKVTNAVKSTAAVGFIKFTLFNLDLMTNEDLGYNAGIPDQNAYLMRNRFQTGEFFAGIVKENLIIQLNAGANEPFWSPWNKGIEFTNDKVKFSWAYLDSMVDVKRIDKITDLKPEDPVVIQYQQDTCGATDQFGLSVTGPTVAVLYNKEGVFGINVKMATEYPYDSESISEKNGNGVAVGIDIVVMPPVLPDLKILASTGGSYNYGLDNNNDPVMAGTRVGYTVHMNDDVSLEPFAGLDAGTQITGSGYADFFEYEAAAGLIMRWPGQAGWVRDYILDKEGRVFPGMSLSWSTLGFSDNRKQNNNSVKFTLFEPKGDDGIFYRIGSEMIIDATHLGQKDWDLLATVYVDYEIPGIFNTAGKLIPWCIICYDNLPYEEDARQNAMKADIGIKLDGVVSNTVLGISWGSGNLINDNADVVAGYLKASVDINF